MRGPSPCQAQKQMDVGHPNQSRIQPRDFNGAPPMLQDICHKNQTNKSQQTSFFKHQYITNPTVSPESLVVAAAQQLTSTLKGNIPMGNETAEALKKVGELFTKIVEVKVNIAKAKEQQNRICTHPDACRAIPLPRVVEQNPRVELSIPRVDKAPKADCCVMQIVANLTTPWFNVQSPMTFSQSRSPRVNAQSSAAQSNYISQDKKRRRRTPTVQYPLTNNEHHAGSNVGMCQHLQANVHCLTGPRSAKLQRETNLQNIEQTTIDSQDPNEMVL